MIKKNILFFSRIKIANFSIKKTIKFQSKFNEYHSELTNINQYSKFE